MKGSLNERHGCSGAGKHAATGTNLNACSLKNRPVLRRTVSAVRAVFLACVIIFSIQSTVLAAAKLQDRESYRNAGNAACAAAVSRSSLKAEKKITGGCVTLSKTSYAYDGQAKKPAVTVRFGGKTLKRNRDYTVSYKNNTRRGTASVIVKGRGIYSGTVVKTFRIK